MNTRIAVIALATGLLLSGCAGQGAEDSPTSASPTATATDDVAETPTPAATPTVTPTASVTPTADAGGLPALEDLKLSSEGLSYVRVGQPVPSKPKAEQIVTWKDNFCGFTGDGEKPGAWKTNYDTIHDGNLAFYVQAVPDKTSKVDVIYILSEKIHTEHGLHIGSPVADVESLGGKKVSGDKSDPFGVTWIIHGSAGELVLSIASDDGEYVKKGQVEHIQVQEEGTDPAWAMEITPCD